MKERIKKIKNFFKAAWKHDWDIVLRDLIELFIWKK